MSHGLPPVAIDGGRFVARGRKNRPANPPVLFGAGRMGVKARTKARPDCWYGIRSIFQFGKKRSGKNIFEERFVVFSAKTVGGAFAKARKEAVRYAKALGMKRHPLMEAYLQDGDELIDGYEVWSVLFESKESLRSFVRNHYDRHGYRPEKGPRIRLAR